MAMTIVEGTRAITGGVDTHLEVLADHAVPLLDPDAVPSHLAHGLEDVDLGALLQVREWVLRDAVERERALGGDLALLLEVEALERLRELLGDARELRVGVRVVARPDDAVGADEW